MKAKPVGPIPFADAPQGAMQGPRYTTFAKTDGGEEAHGPHWKDMTFAPIIIPASPKNAIAIFGGRSSRSWSFSFVFTDCGCLMHGYSGGLFRINVNFAIPTQTWP